MLLFTWKCPASTLPRCKTAHFLLRGSPWGEESDNFSCHTSQPRGGGTSTPSLGWVRRNTGWSVEQFGERISWAVWCDAAPSLATLVHVKIAFRVDFHVSNDASFVLFSSWSECASIWFCCLHSTWDVLFVNLICIYHFCNSVTLNDLLSFS